MPELYLQLIIFVISLFVLIKASDYFTDSAEKIGIYFGMPAFLVGVTIVAVGTSLPELISSVIAVMQGASEIVTGNVVGSNIANIFLVLAISAIIGKKLKITHELIHVDLPLLVGSALFLAVTVWDGVFTLGEGLLSLFGIFLYFHYTVRSTIEGKGFFGKTVDKVSDIIPKKLGVKPVIILIFSTVFIYFGAQYTIESIIALSEILNIGKEIIAVSAVALGTSLPELIVSISAAKKGYPEMAVGNVLGSNIFNSFAVMGIPVFFGPLAVEEKTLTLGVPMMLIATFLYFFMTQDREITRWEGGVLFMFYVFFIGKLFFLF